MVSFLLQEFLLSRSWRRELQQAGGLQDWDATLPPAGVLTGGGRGGGGWASGLIWDLVHFSALLPPYLRLCGAGNVAIIILMVFQPGECSIIEIPLAVNRRGEVSIGKQGAAWGARRRRRAQRRRARRTGGRHAAWHRALSFGISIDQRLSQGVCGGPWTGGHMVLGGADVRCVLLDLLSLSFSLTAPLQQEALWGTV